jgi:peptide-methionine (S)-S-oxide reductase
MSWLGKLGLSGLGGSPRASEASAALAQGPDEDQPAPGNEFAQFGAGCFWGVELAFQRVPGVTRTEVGYSQGNLHEPTYEDVCTGATNHNEVVRVQYDTAACKFDDLLDVFWARHDPTTPNRQVRIFWCWIGNSGDFDAKIAQFEGNCELSCPLPQCFG